MSLASDPQAWLRVFYIRLQSRTPFHELSSDEQFAQLCDAVAADHPEQAEAMRNWTSIAKDALLRDLAESSEGGQPAVSTVLWRVHKDSRELRCIAQYMPSGIDVRLLEGDGFRRTQLCPDATAADALSHEWRTDLLQRGWSTAAPPSHVEN
jgi:hypothetical protein